MAEYSSGHGEGREQDPHIIPIPRLIFKGKAYEHLLAGLDEAGYHVENVAHGVHELPEIDRDTLFDVQVSYARQLPNAYPLLVDYTSAQQDPDTPSTVVHRLLTTSDTLPPDELDLLQDRAVLGANEWLKDQDYPYRFR